MSRPLDEFLTLPLMISALLLASCAAPNDVGTTDGDEPMGESGTTGDEAPTSESESGEETGDDGESAGDGDGDGDETGDGDGEPPGDGDGDETGDGDGEPDGDGDGDGDATGDATSDSDSTEGEDTCGDGVIDPGEACDDQNSDNRDGCLSDCTIPANCLDIYTFDSGASDGDYLIVISDGEEPVEVYCDMTNQGGGWTRLYWNDFSSQASGWTNNTITTCGNFGNMLGGYGEPSDSNSRVFDVRGIQHEEARLEAIYYPIDSWDGELASASIDGGPVWTQLCWQNQDVCNHLSNGHICGGNWADGEISLDVVVEHELNTIQVEFGSTLDQGPTDESFGVSDVGVYVR